MNRGGYAATIHPPPHEHRVIAREEARRPKQTLELPQGAETEAGSNLAKSRKLLKEAKQS